MEQVIKKLKINGREYILKGNKDDCNANEIGYSDSPIKKEIKNCLIATGLGTILVLIDYFIKKGTAFSPVWIFMQIILYLLVDQVRKNKKE